MNANRSAAAHKTFAVVPRDARARRRAAAIGALLLAGAASAAGSGNSTAVSAAARATIDAADAAWLPAMQRGDAGAIAAPYADDGIFVTQSGETVRGRPAIEDLYRKRLTMVANITGQLVQESLVASGSLIYEWGHASTIVVLKDGTTRSSQGAYLTVWQMSASGAWQITRNLVF